MELAYSSALRPRELYNLKITDIDFKRGLLFIEQSKNNKDRIVPVGKTALFWIEKYITEVRPRYIHNKTHNYVFISHKTGEKLTVYGIRWAIQETLRLSGFKPIKTYSLRSTAATALLLNGMSIVYISKLLGHSDIRTTQIYLHIKTIQLQKETLSSLPVKTPRSFFLSFILPTPSVGSRLISSLYKASRNITFAIPIALLTVADEFFASNLERKSNTSARVISESLLSAKGSVRICFSSYCFILA